MLFFFSSRRRHTRLVSDWSSDVCSSDLSDDGAYPEGPPPAIVNHNVGDEKRRGARTDADAGKNQTIGDSPLLRRNPTGDELVRSGEKNGLPGTQKKSCRGKNQNRRNDRSGNGGSQGSENAPPQNADSEHAARTETIGQPSSDGLE